jgi:hypothetical protein
MVDFLNVKMPKSQPIHKMTKRFAS